VKILHKIIILTLISTWIRPARKEIHAYTYWADFDDPKRSKSWTILNFFQTCSGPMGHNGILDV